MLSVLKMLWHDVFDSSDELWVLLSLLLAVSSILASRSVSSHLQGPQGVNGEDVKAGVCGVLVAHHPARCQSLIGSKLHAIAGPATGLQQLACQEFRLHPESVELCCKGLKWKLHGARVA